MNITSLQQENRFLKERVLLLEQQIEWFKRHVFGTGKSEKLDKNQLPLDMEATPVAEAPAKTETISYERTTRSARQSKEATYEHLRIAKTLVIDPEPVKANPEAYELIGEERTFEIGITTPKLYRIEYIKRKYRLKSDRDQAPLIAPSPKRPVQGIASISLLVHVLLSKYVDHLPLYRQEKIFKRYGAQISRQNMVNWVAQVAQWLKPIYNYMRRDLISGNYLQIDETPIKVLDPDSSQKKIRQGWLWPISRPGEDVVFSWSLTRGSRHLEELLEGFSGYLQCDGYSAYSKYVHEHEAIKALGCMAHARRKFKEAESEGQAPLRILGQIAKLYAIEKSLREDADDAGTIYTIRQRKSLPLLEELYEQILNTRKEVLPRSLTGRACDYALGQWKELSCYVQDGHLQIDNNLIENAIRPSALGKKNWMFVGHPRAGERSAIIYSIVVSCERHGVDPSQYLSCVLEEVPYLVNRDQSHLTPKNWAKAKQTQAA